MKRLLAIALVLVSTAYTQVATGNPPFSSQTGGGIDTINDANLNVHLSIPMVSKSGRGMGFSYSLGYDSSVWSPVASDTSTTWQPAANWGWVGLTQAKTGYIAYSWRVARCYDDTIPGYVYYGRYTYHTYFDAGGARHPIGVDIYGENCGNPGNSNGTVISSDGSGLKITIDPQVGNTVTTTEGTVFYPPTSAGIDSGTVLDRNGNKIYIANGVYTDTLGSAALTISAAGSNPMLYTYTDSTGAARAVKVNYSTYTIHTNFGCSGIADYGTNGTTTASLISSIDFPNSSGGVAYSYLFAYEPTPNDTAHPNTSHITGRLKQITLPTGGAIAYVYSGSNNGINCTDGSTRGLSRTASGGATSWTSSNPSGSQWTTDITDPLGNHTMVYFQKVQSSSLLVELERDSYSGAVSGTPLRKQLSCYNGCVGLIGNLATTVSLPIVDKATHVILDDMRRSCIWQGFDSLGALKELYEYDYGLSNLCGPLIRHTVTAFTDIGNNIHAPTSVTVYDGGGAQKAQATYAYDAAAVTASGAIQLNPVTGARGNLTSITQWSNGATDPVTSYTYFDTGMVRTLTDPGGRTTTFAYTDNFSDAVNHNTQAFPTTVTNALGHVASSKYFWPSGVLQRSTDANLRNADYTYDHLLRPSTVTTADGGSATSIYTESSNQAEVQRLMSAGVSSSSLVQANAYGQPTRSATYNGANYDQQDTCYDSLGRASFVSSPYQASGFATSSKCAAPSTDGVLFAYDALGRKTSATNPDGSVQRSYFGANVSANGGRSATICGSTAFPVLSVDEAGKKRQSWLDAFGKLVEVDEPDLSGSLTAATTAATCYSYDTLGNLTQAQQRGGATDTSQWRTRTYQYDFLARLTSATTPESGTETIYYTTSAGGLCSGNPSDVCRRTDARAITTTLSYDALNRVTGVTFTDSTPAIAYFYDQTSANGLTILNGKGLRTGMSDASGTTNWSYDALGRVVTEKRTLAGVTKTTSFSYDLAGNMATITYPSGRTLTYTYNRAGRQTSVKDLANSINFAMNATYTAHGALASVLLGQDSGATGTTLTQSFNSRLQPSQFKAMYGATTVLNFTYGYGAAASNNGQLLTQSNNLNAGRTQSFTYDPLNRLATAQSQATSGADCWGEQYTYDAWANLRQISGTKTGTGCTASSLSMVVNTSNRLTATGVTYDNAGNLTNDGSRAYTWNAQNQITATAGYSYTYDGDGLRVKSTKGKLYWRASGSEPLAETDLAGAFTRQYVYFAGRMIGYLDAANSRYYILADPLGSTRVMVNNTGVVKEDSDFTPYGNERVVTDLLANTRKFTGYERDTESGNDQAIFRSYNPRWGRFMSADPLSGEIGNPQSLNRFAYVLNNPANLFDPLGLCTDETRNISCFETQASSPLGSNGSWFWLFAASGPGFGDFLRMIMGIPPSSSNSSSSNTSPPPDPPKPPPAKPAPTLVDSIKNAVRTAVCAVVAPLVTAATLTGGSVGVGGGGSGGIGLFLGVALGAGAQVIADKNQNVAVAVSLSFNPGIGVYGAGALAGYQASYNTGDLSRVHGASFGGGGSFANVGVDLSSSNGKNVGVTVTAGGVGVGVKGASGGVAISHTWFPLSTNCKGTVIP